MDRLCLLHMRKNRSLSSKGRLHKGINLAHGQAQGQPQGQIDFEREMDHSYRYVQEMLASYEINLYGCGVCDPILQNDKELKDAHHHRPLGG
jgi:hypothetical protein